MSWDQLFLRKIWISQRITWSHFFLLHTHTQEMKYYSHASIVVFLSIHLFSPKCVVCVLVSYKCTHGIQNKFTFCAFAESKKTSVRTCYNMNFCIKSFNSTEEFCVRVRCRQSAFDNSTFRTVAYLLLDIETLVEWFTIFLRIRTLLYSSRTEKE